MIFSIQLQRVSADFCFFFVFCFCWNISDASTRRWLRHVGDRLMWSISTDKTKPRLKRTLVFGRSRDHEIFDRVAFTNSRNGQPILRCLYLCADHIILWAQFIPFFGHTKPIEIHHRCRGSIFLFGISRILPLRFPASSVPLSLSLCISWSIFESDCCRFFFLYPRSFSIIIGTNSFSRVSSVRCQTFSTERCEWVKLRPTKTIPHYIAILDGFRRKLAACNRPPNGSVHLTRFESFPNGTLDAFHSRTHHLFKS